MEELTFQALGTRWSVLVHGKNFLQKDKEELIQFISQFEKQFSRFLPESQVNRFRHAKAGSYQVSEDLAVMLERASLLQAMSDGVYNPAVGALLEHAGYDKNYRFTPDQELENFTAPQWSLRQETLVIESPVVFDLGGIGKGYCIDKVAQFLKERGHQHFLVEAGGDMYGTEKKDGSPFHIALEWPGKPGLVFGTIALKQGGLAVSDSFRRRWPAPAPRKRGEQDWHHIVNPLTKKPIQEVEGAAAIAKTAFDADCMTSLLFLIPEEKYLDGAEKFKGEFVVFSSEGKVKVSSDWPGELFIQEKK